MNINTLFHHQMHAEYPNFTKEEIADLATRRDNGDMEAVRLLILQGLPWAFRCADKWYRRDPDEVVDIAVDAATKCAKLFNPERATLSTMIAKYVGWYAKKRHDYWKKHRLPMQLRDTWLREESEECLIDRNDTSIASVDSLDSANAFRKHLTEQELQVLEYRHTGYKLREISDILGKTKERVRQIEAGAIKKLKRHARVSV